MHTFAGNPLDRADALRRDEAWLDGVARAPASRFLALHKLQALMFEDTLAASDPDARGLSLHWLGGEQIEALGVPTAPVFLGLNGDIAHFAVDVSAADDPLAAWNAAPGVRFEDARMAAGSLSVAETGILAQARSQVDWHLRHGFCARCGAATKMQKGGHVRVCEGCGAHHFPRTDPVAIMLVEDGDRCLLGQSAGRLARTGMYSALAGFVDQGESIEEAVRREVMEEAGVRVGAVRYHSSQPWPYPSSLMIGCLARALSTDITIDPEEMADVRWFDRAEVRRALAGESDTLRVPTGIAIAHHLIKAWVRGGFLTLTRPQRCRT